MPAVQPIPQNTPDPAKQEAAELLGKHNSATNARTRNPAAWNPPTRRGTVSGEASGRRVK
jgi:hypothetical protein